MIHNTLKKTINSSLIVFLFALLFIFAPHLAKAQTVCGEKQGKKSLAKADGKAEIMRTFDRFGNLLSIQETTIPKATDNQKNASINSFSCVAGYFTLHFADVYYQNGQGFDANSNTNIGGATMTLGAARQRVACKVFRDLSKLIVSNLPAGECHIIVHSNFSDQNMPIGAIGVASSYYNIPYPATHLVLDGEVYKSLVSGYNTVENIPDRYTSVSEIDNTRCHGFVQIQFGATNSWNLDYNAIPNNTQNDLYSTILHEATHALGFNSFLQQNGDSKISNNLYSRFDTYLQTNNRPLILISSDGITDYNAALGNDLHNGNYGCANNPIQFRGKNGFTEAIYNPNINAWNDGSSLSHIQCAEDVGCPSAYLNSDNVMTYCSSPGGFKRHLSQTEATILCNMGYTLSTQYGENGSNATILNTYSVCTNCIVGGKNDFYTIPYNTTFEMQPLLNDALGANATLSEVRLHGDYTGTYGSVTQIGNTIRYTPDFERTGWVILTYVPLCNTNNTGERGSTTYIFVYITPPLLPACVPEYCDLICNGDFENVISEAQIADFKNTGDNSSDVFVLRNATMSGRGTNYTTPYFFCGNITNAPLPHGGTKYMGMGSYPSNVEGVHFALVNTALVPGLQYTLSFWSYYGCTGDLDFIFSQNPPCKNVSISDANGITIPSVNCGDGTVFQHEQVLTQRLTNTNQQWRLNTLNFTATHNSKHLTILPKATTQANGNMIYLLLDDIKLQKQFATPINITTTASNTAVCIGESPSITYTICTNDIAANTQPEIALQLTLPNGITINTNNPNNNFVTESLTLPAINNRCRNVVLSVNIDNNQSLIGQNLPIQLITTSPNICFSSNNIQQFTTNITPISLQNIRLTQTIAAPTSMPVPNGSPVTYRFEVCNTGSFALQNISVNDVLVAGLSAPAPNAAYAFDTNTQTLTFNPIQLAAATNGIPTCKTLTFSTIANYPNNSNRIQNTAQASILNTDCAAQTSNTTTIIENCALGATLSGNTQTQIGAGTLLSVAANNSNAFVWSTGETTANINVFPTQNTTYTVTVTGEFGCSQTATIRVIMCPALVLAAAKALCKGQGITATSNIPNTVFTWNDGSTTANFIPQTTGTFTVIATALEGCTAIASTNITLQASPIVTLIQNIFPLTQQAATLTATLAPPLDATSTFVWSTGETTPNITIKPGFTYTVTVTNSIGCSTIRTESIKDITEISIFPNPADTHINIALPLKYKTATFVFVDMLGRILLETTVENPTGFINLPLISLVSGTYNVEIRANNERIYSKKIVLMRY